MATGGARDDTVMVCLKTEKGIVRVKLSAGLAQIVLDPNGDPATKQAIKDAVLGWKSKPQENAGSSNINEHDEQDNTPEHAEETSHSQDEKNTPNIPVSQTQIHNWTDNEIRLLLELRLGDDRLFTSVKNHETLWKKITDELNSKNIKVTKTQVMNKWKILKKKYKEVVDNNGKTGNSKEEWKYFETFNQAYGNKAATTAAITYDSARSEKLKAKATNETPGKKKTPSKACTTTGIKRKTELEDLSCRVEAQNAKLMGVMRKQHNDKMRRMDRFLNIFAKSVNQSDDVQGQGKSQSDDGSKS